MAKFSGENVSVPSRIKAAFEFTSFHEFTV